MGSGETIDTMSAATCEVSLCTFKIQSLSVKDSIFIRDHDRLLVTSPTPSESPTAPDTRQLLISTLDKMIIQKTSRDVSSRDHFDSNRIQDATQAVFDASEKSRSLTSSVTRQHISTFR